MSLVHHYEMDTEQLLACAREHVARMHPNGNLTTLIDDLAQRLEVSESDAHWIALMVGFKK